MSFTRYIRLIGGQSVSVVLYIFTDRVKMIAEKIHTVEIIHIVRGCTCKRLCPAVPERKPDIMHSMCSNPFLIQTKRNVIYFVSKFPEHL